jgi:hypothetical protein
MLSDVLTFLSIGPYAAENWTIFSYNLNTISEELECAFGVVGKTLMSRI